MSNEALAGVVYDRMLQAGVANVRVEGDEVWCACPWHPDTNPSFSFNTEKLVGNCFACGTKFGTLQSFIFGLSERTGVPLDDFRWGDTLPYTFEYKPPPEPPRPLNKGSLRFYKKDPDHFVGAWGISEEVVFRHNLLLDPQNGDECFPMVDWGGEYWGCVHRREGGRRSVYRYPPNAPKSSLLIGEDTADRPEVWVTEGIKDVCRVETHVPGARAVAIGSATPSQKQIAKLLEYDSVVLALDDDPAGRIGSETLLNALPITMLKIARYDGSDPGDSTKFEAVGTMELLLQRARGLL